MVVHKIIHNESDMHNFAQTLAKRCRIGDCIALRGDLGAGKTTFARGFIEALHGAGEVVSPTFTLVQTYDIEGGMIWHFDLYRLTSPEDIVEIGLDEALQSGLTLIGWPEMVEQQLPPQALHIAIGFGGSEEERKITLTGDSAWKGRLENLW